MFNSNLYVYYDKASEKLVDCFIHDTDNAAKRFVAMRVSEAIRKENYGLLSLWRDCEVYKLDLSCDKIEKVLLIKLSDIIPAEIGKVDEKN